MNLLSYRKQHKHLKNVKLYDRASQLADYNTRVAKSQNIKDKIVFKTKDGNPTVLELATKDLAPD